MFPVDVKSHQIYQIIISVCSMVPNLGENDIGALHAAGVEGFLLMYLSFQSVENIEKSASQQFSGITSSWKVSATMFLTD